MERDHPPGEAEAPKPATPTKKARILALNDAGVGDVAELAALAQARPSYVAAVLQRAGRLSGYYDLYTRTSRPMNIYAKYFGDRLGFKDPETAAASVATIDRLYSQFGAVRDRAGQHHALVVALTLCARARWSGKRMEAAFFRRWLTARLEEDGEETLH